MKTDKMAVLVTNKKGDVYQVALTDKESETVFSLIYTIQGGKIKCLPEKLELTIGKKL